MASPKLTLARFAALRRWFPYAGAIGLFLWLCAQFYLPGQGFTYLVMFGGRESARYLPELRAMSFYAERDSWGYDAQYYAQIAMHPNLGDPVLRDAVDTLPYRARRILFCWTAYVLGLGNPAWALHMFSVQNIIAWLMIAWVLLRWFPPTGMQNFVRWFAVMYTFGLVTSVRESLLDGPSLLLIAVGMVLLEKGRPWWSAAVLGIAGLGKETNILAGSVFLPKKPRQASKWRTAALRIAIVVAPLALWLVCLELWVGEGGDLGARNFDWPFVGYFGKWQETIMPFFGQGSAVAARAGLYAMVGLTVQLLFFALRPRWRDPWWRIGASYGALMIVLGEAVWEGFPGAAPRVLLPMTLAFNIVLPRARRWWVVLLLGNLLLLPSFNTLVPPGKESYQVIGARDLRVNDATGDEVSARFDESEWYWLERSHFDYWRWARGPAKITLHNPHPFAVITDLKFRLKSSDSRQVTVRLGERVLWSGPTEKLTPELVIPAMRLEPGETALQFDSDRPAATPPNRDVRKVAYRVINLRIVLREGDRK